MPCEGFEEILVTKEIMVWLVSWEESSVVIVKGHTTIFSLLKTEDGSDGRYGITIT